MSAHRDRIAGQVRAGSDASLALLRLEGDVDVVVRDDPRRVIPEIGIGGFAPDGHSNPRYGHWAWFFGGEELAIPRWTGVLARLSGRR